MVQQEDVFKKLISHSKEYGFVFPSSEIYDGLGAVYDYGQNGVELKNNIKKYWWDSMTLLNENVAGIDSAIFMHPTIWKASGHVDAFNDPLIDNKDSKKRYRADVLIEEQFAKYDDKIEKEVGKAAARFGAAFDERKFRETHPRVLENVARRETLHRRFVEALNRTDLEELRQIIIDEAIVCPVSGTRNWTEVRQFNLMFSTEMGSTADGAMKIYLRPETAQGIFVNFLNVQKSGRMKIPFGIAQIGKAFRNEIVARQFVFRMREFEQMEMQFFVRPGEELQWFDHWKQTRMRWHKALGLGDHKYRFHDHDKLAHYANAATDIEFEMPFGFKEVEGIHSRTDFDLSSHEKYSGKKIQYFDPELNRSYVPYVIETSIGVDRMFLSILAGSFCEEQLPEGETRVVLKLPPALAPVKLAVLPLVKKDGLPEKAREIMNDLKFDFQCQYDEKDSIGKRYRRQDAIGTPYCVTIDHDTLVDNQVTVRHRDTMEQERTPISDLNKKIEDKVSMKKLLRNLFTLAVPLLLLPLTACNSNDDTDQWRKDNQTAYDAIKANPEWKLLDTNDGPTGIFYKALENGDGTEHPLQTSQVKVLFWGTYYDETFFMVGSSQTNISITLDVNDYTTTPRGLSVALQNMVVGDHWEICVPYYLGFGTGGLTDSYYTTVIKGYSTLFYNVELIKINQYP